MAPFSRRQTAYIRAIADQGKHDTFIEVMNRPATSGLENYDDSLVGDTSQAHCKYKLWCLGDLPQVFDSGTVNTTAAIADSGAVEALGVFSTQFAENTATENISKNALVRGTGEVFLDKTTLNFRCLFDPVHFDDSTKARHGEFRFIVFRHKEKQSTDIKLAQNFSNPLYDLFLNGSNYKCGIKGYRDSVENGGTLHYTVGTGAYNEASALMTSMINKEDYVVMKDVRFFLGPRFGKSHYETRMDWNWNTVLDCNTVPGETVVDITEQADHSNNFKWYCMLIGTRLHSADDATGGSLLNVRISGTTTCKSQ